MLNQAMFCKFVSFATACDFTNAPSAPFLGTEGKFARLTRGDVVIEVQDRGGHGLHLQLFRLKELEGHPKPLPVFEGRCDLSEATSCADVIEFIVRAYQLFAETSVEPLIDVGL